MNRLEIAKQLDYLREAGANAGLRVEGVQKWCDGQKGDSWCCEFATMVLDMEYKGKSPIPRLRACQDVYDLAKKNGWLVPVPRPGDLFLYVDTADHAHHIGFVTHVVITNEGTLITGIAGNTSGDGTSSNGDGVYEHLLQVAIEHMRFVRTPAGG